MRRFLIAFSLVFSACGGSTASAPAADAAQDGAADGVVTDTAVSPDTATDVPSDGGCSCLSAQLSWGQDGGHVVYTDGSTLTGCNDYARNRLPSGSTTPSLTCTDTIRKCVGGDAVDASDATTVHDVEVALADADVKAALAKAPILYGYDSRPVDGSVFRVTVSGKTIDVGGDCAGHTGCTDVPAGLAHLRTVLQTLDAQKQLGPCAAFAP